MNYKQRYHLRRQYENRRGAGLVLAVILMFVLFSFLAFSIDTGYLAQTKAEMRRTADSAALAGCWELYSNLEQGIELEESESSVRASAAQMAGLNPICKEGPYLDESPLSQDINVGYLSSPSDQSLSSDDSDPFFAVRVNVSRTAEKNGEVPFFFGRIFGDSGQAMSTGATAVMARQISGFELPPGSDASVQVLPFALDVDTWDAMLADGTGASDNFAFNSATGNVSGGRDGILEVNLFPQGTGSPGNRGTVDIGGSNNSTNDIARQIVSGISAEDLEELNKPLNLNLNGGTMTLNGDTGISAGVKDELSSIIGQKRVIPLFSSVQGNGNNANYTICRWVGVRILEVKLTGKMTGKRVMVQPAPMIIDNAIYASTPGQWSDFVLSPVLLAQ